jgi:hypothetical protein
MAVKATFEELYGKDRVHILDMMTPHGVEIEFLSNPIINATHAVEMVKGKGELIKQNQALSLVLERMDTDLIMVHGHRERLINQYQCCEVFLVDDTSKYSFSTVHFINGYIKWR